MDPTHIGGWIASAGIAAWGVFQSHRLGKANKENSVLRKSETETSALDLAQRNAELTAAYKTKADEWKAAYDKEHSESQAYREKVHTKVQEQNEYALKLTEENALLRAKTDLTPLVEHMAAQTATNQKVADTLANLTKLILRNLKASPEPEEDELPTQWDQPAAGDFQASGKGR